MKNKIVDVLLVIFGSMMMGLSIDLIVKADFGLDPLSLFIVGVGGQMGISLGTGSQLLMIIIIAALFIIDRKRIGLGSILNGILVGAFVKLFLPFVDQLSGNITFRIIILIVGFILMGAGIGTYVAARLGEAGIDALMMFIADKLHKDVNITRIVIDILLALTGFIFGGKLGIATIISMIVNGYIIQFTINTIDNIRRVK